MVLLSNKNTFAKGESTFVIEQKHFQKRRERFCLRTNRDLVESL